MRMLKLLYPEQRTISETEIATWAKDEWENTAPARRCSLCGTVTVTLCFGQPVRPLREGEYLPDDADHPCMAHLEVDDEAFYDNEQEPPLGLEEQMDFLEDLGIATFVRRRN